LAVITGCVIVLEVLADDRSGGGDSLVSRPRHGGNRWEKLEGNREGQDAIRINDQYRICYVWTGGGPAWVEITDYH